MHRHNAIFIYFLWQRKKRHLTFGLKNSRPKASSIPGKSQSPPNGKPPLSRRRRRRFMEAGSNPRGRSSSNQSRFRSCASRTTRPRSLSPTSSQDKEPRLGGTWTKSYGNFFSMLRRRRLAIHLMTTTTMTMTIIMMTSCCDNNFVEFHFSMKIGSLNI